jgi:enoyl-CoA hydratase/carnithine racemase
MSKTLTTSITSGIATVTLNRPQKKNAMSFEMMGELYEIGCALKETSGLRAVIINGSDGTFCAGIDLADLMQTASQLNEMRQKLSHQIAPEIGNFFQAPCTIWAQLDVPVIAAINGIAIGAGAQLALGADFRIMAPNARFGLLEAKWGLIPDMGVTQSLPQLIRADQAMDLMMTGRLMDADETLAMGLTTRISDDPLEAAIQMAEGFAQQSPDALRGCKRLINTTWGKTTTALSIEAELQSQIIGMPHQMEKVAATLAKRPATFK